MKTKDKYVVFAWLLCLLISCQQDEIMHKEPIRANTAPTGSVASRSVNCEVTTTEAGTLMEKLDEIAITGGYTKEEITDLTISGPVNREDLRALRPFEKIVKLDMTDLNIVDEYGNTLYDFPDVLDSFASPAHVYLPKNLTSINWQAFRESKIVAIDMSDNITSIGGYAFDACKNLHTVKLSNNLEEIWYGAFENCPSLITINAPEKLKRIGGAAFNGCAFASFAIPETVEIIEWNAFSNNPNLETVNWPSKVTTIPGACFYNCPKLKFDIPNYITKIGDSAFRGCIALTSLSIPSSVEEIQGWAFESCPNLLSVTLPSTLTNVGEYAFANCEKLQSINDISNWTKIPHGMFENCNELEINIPLQVDTIGDRAFWFCKKVTAPSLKQLRYLGHYALYSCTSLTILSSSLLEFIGEEALANTSIKELTIPFSVQYIGNNIVASCDNLKAIYWETNADMPQLFYPWEETNALIYVPMGINYNSSNKNLIFGDDENGYTIEKYEINADKDFYCPKAFTAKEIVYRKHFGAWTHTDKPSGWRTIALPFAVTKFVAQATDEQPERELKPFGSENMGEAKPFWLRTLHSDGFERETTLEAGKPYIIAFPYNTNYYLPEYNISGTVEFWGENVTVIENAQLTPIIGTTYTFQPTFERIKKSMDIYNIDYDSYYDRMYNIHHEGGSLFRSSIRDTEPFESYITNNVTGRTVIPVNGTSASRSTKKLGQIPMEDDM